MVAGLFFFLVLAVIMDLRTFRIPNALTMAGMAAGVICQLYRAGPPGMFEAVKNLICSILILFPLYLLKCLGAGDIKLLSVITIFLGWKQGMKISIYSLFAGAAIGIMKGSILFAIRHNLLKKEGKKQRKEKITGKEAFFYSAAKAAKKLSISKKETKKEIKKEVFGRLREKSTSGLRITETDKNRQKNRKFIEQIRIKNQLSISNKISKVFKSIKSNKSSKSNKSNKMQQKKETGYQGCVIHYSIAILIAFLIARLG